VFILELSVPQQDFVYGPFAKTRNLLEFEATPNVTSSIHPSI
jgi:hypothetical protein